MSFRKLLATALLIAAAAVPALAQEVAVGGRVVALGGDPLPGVEVQLLPLVDSFHRSAMDFDGISVEPVGRALTDDDGHYRLTAPGAGLWRIVIQAPGFVPVAADLMPLIEPRELADAELSPDEGITVKVVDPGGAPVAGASVRIGRDTSRLRFGQRLWNPTERRGTTGDDGTVRLARDAAERAAVSVLADGHPYVERTGLSGTATRVELPRGKRIPLVVRDGEGRPVAGALVQIEDQPVGRTDEEGLIAVHAAKGKPRELHVLAADDRQLQAKLTSDLPSDKPHPLVLEDRLAVSGRLIDGQSRKPVEGALVWDRENPAGAVKADRAGGFALAAPAGSRLQVTGGAAGYMNASRVEFLLNGDGRPGPTLVLEPAAAIEGTVVDDAGTPVAGAQVELKEKQTPGMFRISIGGNDDGDPRALTNAKGKFRIGPVSPDKAYDLKARAEGFAPTVTVVRDLEPYRTKQGVRVPLERGQAITGRVVDGESSPIAEASVQLEKAQARGGHGMMRMMDGGDPDRFTGTSDSEGRFEVRGVPAGTYDVTVKRPGFAKARVDGVEMAEGDKPVDVGDVTMQPGERLHGYVVDGEGLPVEGAEISVAEAGGPKMMMMVGPGGPPRDEKPAAVSDPSGFFQLEDLSPTATYDISASRGGYLGGNAAGLQLPRTEPVELKLEPASDITGKVLDPEGNPIAGANVNMTRSTSIEMGGSAMQMMMMSSEETDSEGVFLFEDQRPGTVSLAATASGWQEAKLQDIEVPKGEDLSVDLPLKPGSIVEGRIFAADGRAAIGARVSKVQEGGQGMRMGGMGGSPSDGSGYYRLEGLVPGTVSIEATHDDYPRVVKDIEVKEGLNALDLHFEGGQEVTGIVMDEEGKTVGGAAVRLVPAGRFYGGPETTSNGDGSFTMPGVPDGDYSLRADAEGYASAREDTTISVSGQPVAGLEIRMSKGATIVGQIVGLSEDEYSRVAVSASGSLLFGGESSPIDRNGNFRIENMRPETYTVVGSVANSGRQAREKVTIEPGALEVSVTLTFGGGLTLSGRAVQGETPIADSIVYTQGIDVDHSGWNETDSAGEFTIEGLEAGKYKVRLQNWQTGLSYAEEVDITSNRDIELKVPTAQVRGRILDASDRQPLAGVTVTLEAAEPDPQRWRPDRSGTTDMDGRFTLDAVGDGSWRMKATKQGYAADSRSINVQFDRAMEEVQLSLDPTEGLVLEARLPGGAVPDELQVAVLDPSGAAVTSGSFATGESGRVRLSSVPPGSWELIVSGYGAGTTNLTAQAPGPAVAVQLQPATSLKVRIPDLQSTPGVATVRVKDGNGRPFRSLGWQGSPRSEWRITDGTIDFRSLPPGSWTVEITAADGRAWQGSQATSPGVAAELVIE